MGTMKDGRIVGRKEFLGYALGTFGYAMMFVIFNSYMVLYLNTIILIPAATVGIITLIVRITDAFTDIGFAAIGDRTKTKLGAYRPWLLAFAIPSGLFTALYFAMPDGIAANQNSAIAWGAIFFFLAASIGMTVLQTSLGSLGIIASPAAADRKTFGVLRQWGNQAGGLLIYLIGMPLILHFSGEGATTPTKSGFAAIGWIAGALIAVFTLISVFTVKERVAVNATEKVPFKSMMKAIGKNPIAWGAMITNIANQVNMTIGPGLCSYIFIYVFKRPDLMSPVMATSMAVAILFTTFITPRVTAKISRKIFVPAGCALMVIGFVLTYIATGILNPVIFTVGYCLFNTMTGLVMVSVFQAYPDAADYGEHLSGVQIPGLVNAIASYATKIAMGIGTIIVTACLEIAKFDATLGVNQSAGTILGLRSIFSFGNIIFVIVGFVGFLVYNRISQERLAEIRIFNAQKRSEQK